MLLQENAIRKIIKEEIQRIFESSLRKGLFFDRTVKKLFDRARKEHPEKKELIDMIANTWKFHDSIWDDVTDHNVEDKIAYRYINEMIDQMGKIRNHPLLDDLAKIELTGLIKKAAKEEGNIEQPISGRADSILYHLHRAVEIAISYVLENPRIFDSENKIYF